MSRKLRLALCSLVLGIISLTTYHSVRDEPNPKESATGPTFSQSRSERHPAELHSPGLEERVAPTKLPAPVVSPPKGPRDWSGALVLKERIEAASQANPSTRVRHRIIMERGFSNPIHIVDAVESDPANGQESTALVSARIANQILLGSTTTLDAEEVADIAASLGWRIASEGPSRYIAVLETDQADFETVDAALDAVAASGSPLKASPNQIYYTLATPNDPRFASKSQWGLTQPSDVDIDAPEGWDVRKSASSIVVAIVDTGIRASHEDLKSNLWSNPGDLPRNGRDDDGNGYTDDVNGIDTINTDTTPNDDNGHGTHVAGIIGAAGNNGRGITGVAWDVQLMAIKSLNADGRGTSSSVVKGIDYATANGARIINASWGSDSSDHIIEQAIERARDRGILFVAAAGNDGAYYPSYPASSWLDNVVSVGANDKFGNLSSFSNHSESEVDVLAPGSTIVSTWHESDDAYTEQNGTSMAAPFVSGILALNLAQYPDDDYAYQIRRLIASSKARSNLRHYARSGGIVSLAGSLKMSHVPSPPRILTNWSSASSIDEGGEVSFYVEAESELELTYKWYHNGQLLSETSTTLVLQNVQPYQRGQYMVEVINADATVPVSFELGVSPRMREIEALIGADIAVFASHEDHWELVEEEEATEIANKALAQGVTATLRFISKEPGMLQLSGKKPNAPSDNTTTSLNAPNNWGYFSDKTWSQWEARRDRASGFQVTLNHDSRYHGQATPAHSLFLRIPKFFALDELPPTMWSHPQSQTVRIGEIVYLSVYASGENLKYQWYKNGSVLDGETRSDFELIVESADDGGNYYATVSNEKATSTSNFALIEVDTSPQPASAVIEEGHPRDFKSGDPLTLSMRIFGAQPIRHQWYKDGVPIPGATSARLSLGPASVVHQGRYQLAVENDLNDYPAFSHDLYIYVSEQMFPPKFAAEDKKEKLWQLAEGQYSYLELYSARGSHPIEYQWFKDGEPVAIGSSYISFSPAAATDAGVYYLEARNNLGVDQSGRIQVLVTPPLADALDHDALTVELPWGNRPPFVPLFQSSETWDGQDAIELFSDKRLGSSYLALRNNEERRVITFRWKIEQDTAGELEISGHVHRTLTEQGKWKEETVLLEPYSYMEFALAMEDGEGRAWLDGFEEVKEPYLLKDVSFSLPKPDGSVILAAEMLGEGLAFQWFKNDVAIAGATSRTFAISRFAAKDAGNYRLEASNAHGSLSTSTAAVALDSIEAVIPPPLSLTTSDDSKVILDRENGESFIRFDLRSDEIWTLESRVTGPATLSISHAIWGSNATLSIGSKTHTIGDFYEKSQSDFFVPSGEHRMTLSIQSWYEPFPGKLYSLILVDSPLARVRQNDNYEVADYGVPVAEFSGAEPLSVTWFRDGEAISTLSNVKSGQSVLFARNNDGHDHGTYHIEVTDARGKTSTSEPLLYWSQFLGQIVDFEGSLYLNADNVKVDRQSKVKGVGSLLIHAPFYQWPSPQIALSLSTNYATLSLRSAGFPQGAEIRYFSEGSYQTIPANGDWTTITIESKNNYLSLLLPEATEESKVWLDNLVPARRAKFYDQPRGVATYLGASISFEARAYEPSVGDLKTHWTKDGQTIGSDPFYRLEIDDVSLEDLGTYQATVTSPNGQVVKSRAATLSLLTTDLASAIGYPGARITTIGNVPWKIDYADSVDGASSVVSGALEPGESTTIEIDIDGPAAWGLYSYEFDDANLQYGNWNFHSAPIAPTAESSRLSYSVYEYEDYWEPNLNPGIRLDGVRLTRFSDRRYEQWIEEKLAGMAAPLAMNRKDRAADPDRDGLPNWLEFVLGLDPATASALPTVGIVQSDIGVPTASVQFYAARSNEYSIGYEASFDLENWFTVKPSMKVVNSTSGYDNIRATFDLGASNENPYFIRWSVHPRAEGKTGTF